MRVIIDTNVLVSAALKGEGPARVILFVVSDPEMEWVVSPEILREYREVLARKKFAFSRELLDRWSGLLDRVTTLIDAGTEFPFPRDPKDAPFLACAVAADADFLVTGDRDFVAARKLGKTKVVSVSQFQQFFSID